MTDHNTARGTATPEELNELHRLTVAALITALKSPKPSAEELACARVVDDNYPGRLTTTILAGQ